MTHDASWNAIADILAGQHDGQTVRLRGWVHRQRTGGKLAFVTLRDGTGTLQCTVKAGVADDESLAAAKDALIESSVSLLEGDVVADERAPGGYEVRVTRFVLHQRSDDFPLRGEQGTDFELDNRHLWLRSTQLSAILRIKSELLLEMRRFMAAEGFVEMDPSVITTNACEGGSTLFTFDYFGKTAYLSQSSQMYLEGCIFGNPKVYGITNSFRAEKSRTSKHLTEFHHFEPEAAWWDNDDNMAFQERLVEHLAHHVADACEDDLKRLDQDPERLRAVKAPFERLSYDDAVARLQELGFEFPHGEDLGAPHEHALTEGKTSPVFITDWPARIKAFYMHQDPENPDRVKCSDLLGPDGFGELIGGSQRSEDIDWMKRRLREQLLHEIREDKPGILEQVAIDHLEVREAYESLVTAAPSEAHQLLVEVHERTPGAEHKGQPLTPEAIHAHFHGEGDIDADPLGLWDALQHAVTAPYEWYFDLRRYGSVPHSGFGLGIERLLRWFTGQEHIRDMLPYPRTPSRAYP